MSDGLTGEVRPFPEAAIKRAAPIFVDFDIGYRNSLWDRAHRLAPVIWAMTDPAPSLTWEQAIQEPKMAEAMAKCIATAELCVRLVDVINLPIATDFLSRIGF